MDAQVEHEICGNCKKEIPQPNYVMHTAHCARNITLCQTCKEPIPKNQYDDHKKSCRKPVKPKKVKSPSPPPIKLENSHYFQQRKEIEERKIAARKERELKKYERLVDTGYTLKETTKLNGITTEPTTKTTTIKDSNKVNGANGGSTGTKPRPLTTTTTKLPTTKAPFGSASSKCQSNGLLACKYCDLELAKLDLEEHENYCGSRTDKCLECGELVMFKYKQIHQDSNHGFLKLRDEPGPRPSWESTTNRSEITTSTTRPRPPPFVPFTTVDATLYSFPTTLPTSGSASAKKEKGESYKEISRRLDCKTEYIRNLLHDSASITVPLRHNGAVPRNHFNHNKGPAPQPPRRRSRNPPTELLIPCEFCHTPIPHEDLIQHETGCRPDLARFNPRRRSSPESDDYFVAPPPPSPGATGTTGVSLQEPPSSPEVELPCEFCADMIPASQLLRHQAACI